MNNIKDKDKFKIWLIESKCLSHKSACDVISRFNRAYVFLGKKRINFLTVPIEDILIELSRSYEFKILNSSLKSQLKRSFKLYNEYLSKPD